MKVAIIAAKTSHILQSCDQLIHKRFQALRRQLRDEFCRRGCIDTARVNFNIDCAVQAWAKITLELIQVSFKVTGAFPFQRNVAAKYRKYKDQPLDPVNDKEKSSGEKSVAFRLASVRKRRSDQNVLYKTIDTTEGSRGASTELNYVKTTLKNEETFNNLLMRKLNRHRGKIVSGCAKPKERVTYDAGPPAKTDNVRRRTYAKKKSGE